MKCLIENKDTEIIIKNSRFITSLIKIDETSNLSILMPLTIVMPTLPMIVKSQVMMVNQVVLQVYLC